MFDTIKALWAGFAQRLAGTKADKLVWILLAAFGAGWLATAFAAWVSYPSYSAAVSFLPNGQTIAALATGGIAAVVYFCLSNLSGFAVERWRGTDPAARNYEALGARIVAIVAALGMTLDIYMNLQGSEYRAKDAAGSVATYEYQTPQARLSQIEQDQSTLADLRAGKIGGYGWRDPKSGIYYLNNSGKRYQRELSANVRRLQLADSTDRAAELDNIEAMNGERAEVEGMAKESLTKAVWGVYGFILLLCVLQAYCVEVIQETLGQSTSRSQRRAQRKTGNASDEPKPASAAATRKTSDATKSISLEDSSQTSSSSQTSDSSGRVKQCKHCGTEYHAKRRDQQYCSTTCRMDAWEQRNGKKLRKGRTTSNT